MKVYAFMERGNGKQVCEDSVLVNGEILKEGFCEYNGTCDCIAIADGVGGNAGGSEASEFVLRRLNAGLTGEIREAVVNINNDLINYAKNIVGKEQMATTMSAILFLNGIPAKIVHIGNTRISAIQGEYLKQLSHDHTTVEYLKLRGDFDAADNAPKNEITACLGSGISSRISQLQIEEIDKQYAGFVLTSDGIHDYLDDEIIENFIVEGDYSESSFSILNQKARENGSTDDRSIIVLKIGEK